MTTTRRFLGSAFLIGGLIGLVLLIPGLFGDGGAPMRVLLGWGGFVVTAGLLAAGLLLITQPDGDLDAPWEALIFAELLFLALLVFSHIGRANPLGAARAGQGGGLVGWAGSELLVERGGRDGGARADTRHRPRRRDWCGLRAAQVGRRRNPPNRCPSPLWRSRRASRCARSSRSFSAAARPWARGRCCSAGGSPHGKPCGDWVKPTIRPTTIQK